MCPIGRITWVLKLTPVVQHPQVGHAWVLLLLLLPHVLAFVILLPSLLLLLLLLLLQCPRPNLLPPSPSPVLEGLSGSFPQGELLVSSEKRVF